MAKFNKASNVSNKTENLAGGEAFVQSPKLELVSILLTSFVEDQYYRKAGATMKQLKTVYDRITDKTFPAKAAIYTRNEFGMRSISHVMAAIIAGDVKGVEWTKRFFDGVVRRPDDMTEILALVGKPVPNALKKGFAEAFKKFDGYQLAKYRGEGKSVSLVDVVNLVHPKPNEHIDKLVKGTLKSTGKTWESKLSAAGRTEDVDGAKKQAWADLLKENKLGYFALLRNLRNILEQAPEVLDVALVRLTDRKAIKKSLVLPFRHLTAIEQFTNYSDSTGMARTVVKKLSEAAEIAVDNIPVFGGSTLIAVDTSGSMEGRPSQIASFFAAALAKSNNADVMRFDNYATYVNYNPSDSVTTIAQLLKYNPAGTNFHVIFEEANKAYDRIVILSDMQAWERYNVPTAAYGNYKRRTGANPRVYSFDLAGHGSMQFPERNVYTLAGFSEKVFDVMKLLEQDRDALIKTIEKVEL